MRSAVHVLVGSRSPKMTTPKMTAVIICDTLPHVHTTTLLPSFKPRVWHTSPNAVSPTDAPRPRSTNANDILWNDKTHAPSV